MNDEDDTHDEHDGSEEEANELERLHAEFGDNEAADNVTRSDNRKKHSIFVRTLRFFWRRRIFWRIDEWKGFIEIILAALIFVATATQAYIYWKQTKIMQGTVSQNERATTLNMGGNWLSLGEMPTLLKTPQTLPKNPTRSTVEVWNLLKELSSTGKLSTTTNVADIGGQKVPRLVNAFRWDNVGNTAAYRVLYFSGAIAQSGEPNEETFAHAPVVTKPIYIGPQGLQDDLYVAKARCRVLGTYSPNQNVFLGLDRLSRCFRKDASHGVLHFCHWGPRYASPRNLRRKGTSRL